MVLQDDVDVDPVTIEGILEKYPGQVKTIRKVHVEIDDDDDSCDCEDDDCDCSEVCPGL